MGKIRVTTLGSEAEKADRVKREVQREEKKKRKEASVHLKNQKGGQKVKSVGAQSEAEIEKMVALAHEVESIEEGGVKTETKKKQLKKAKVRGSNYKVALIKLDPKKNYLIEEAFPLLREVSYAKFNPTVELHINTVEKGLRGKAALPHGTGKKLRVVIASEDNVDKLVAEIATGKINFDALIAHPKVVGQLAKVAKFLGPRGLMPNPKNGTISVEPEKVAKKLEAGEVDWKTEPEFPLIHQTIGKLSFKDNQLIENYQSLIKSIGTTKIQKIVLKSSMSPGIKIQFS